MYNERGFNTIILLIAAAVIIIGGGVYFAMTGTDDDDGTVNIALTNTNSTENTNTAVTNTTVVNTNATVTTNQSTNTSANTNTTVDISDYAQVTTDQALADPTAYDGQSICLTGPYQESFEFTAFGSALTYDPDGNLQVAKPYIWRDAPLENEEALDCRTTDVGQEVCTGEVTACGRFEAAATGEDGFGHVNAYRYQITQSQQESSQNSLQPST